MELVSCYPLSDTSLSFSDSQPKPQPSTTEGGAANNSQQAAAPVPKKASGEDSISPFTSDVEDGKRKLVLHSKHLD